MGTETAIAWTDHTFSPWWGCERVSPACNHCYAEAFAKRTGHDVWGKNADRRLLSDATWRNPIKWTRAAEAAGERRRVFSGSMCDVFEDRIDLLTPRLRLFALIEETPWLDWQLLTKRPQNVHRMVPWEWRTRWPKNAWIGTTVEDQQRAEERIRHIEQLGTWVRFLSCEPLLGPIDLTSWLTRSVVDWVIIGAESGPKRRPTELKWMVDLAEQCQARNVPVFIKQDTALHPGQQGRIPGDIWALKQFPRSAA